MYHRGMKSRPRIDLDGVPLVDPDKQNANALAIFRYRTTDGLILLMPESADFTVSWDHITECAIDLVSGDVRVAFDAEWAGRQNWLRGGHQLVGQWTDRYVMGA